MTSSLSKKELHAMDAYWRASNYLGYGYKPYFVEGSDPETMHQLMADTLDTVIAEIKAIQRDARTKGSWRSHQVPFADMATKPDHVKLLEEWMTSYRPGELFDENGKLIPELAELAPKGHRRMGDNPHANGGLLLKDLKMPDFRDYAVGVPKAGQVLGEATRVMGHFLRDVMKRNDLDRFHLVEAVIDRVPKLGYIAAYAKQAARDKLIEHKQYIAEYGQDMPEIRDWAWKWVNDSRRPQLVLIASVMVYTGWPIHRTGWLALRHRTARLVW